MTLQLIEFLVGLFFLGEALKLLFPNQAKWVLLVYALLLIALALFLSLIFVVR
jgi:hypothetical protein